jgi:hypothetical protein
MEPHRPPIENLFRVEGRGALDLGAKAEFREFLRPGDSGSPGVQARGHFLCVVADRGHDAHAGHDDASHP